MAFTWENHRRADGTLELRTALAERAPSAKPTRAALEFIDDTEELCGYIRRPAAAEIVLAHALELVSRD